MGFRRIGAQDKDRTHRLHFFRFSGCEWTSVRRWSKGISAPLADELTEDLCGASGLLEEWSALADDFRTLLERMPRPAELQPVTGLWHEAYCCALVDCRLASFQLPSCLTQTCVT